MRRLLGACVAVLMAAVLASLAFGGSGRAPAGRWVIRDLGTLGGPGSVAIAINERGEVVGRSFTPNVPEYNAFVHETDGFLWHDGRMRSLGASTSSSAAGSSVSSAVAINEHGQVAGTGKHAFLWQDGRIRDLGTLGGKSSEAVAINERGQVAGRADLGRKDSTGSLLDHAFVWTGGRMVDLSVHSNDASWALRLNDRGQVLVVSLDQDGLWENGRFLPLEAFGGVVDLNERGEVLLTSRRRGVVVWQQGRVRRLARMLPQRGCEGSDINDRGVAVGVCGDVEKRARPVIWTGRIPTEIGIVFGDRGWAVAVNNANQVVGHSTRMSSPRHAFVWQKGRTTDLGTLGGRNSEATAINDHGQIIGWAETTTGDHHAVLWTWKPARS